MTRCVGRDKESTGPRPKTTADADQRPPGAVAAVRCRRCRREGPTGGRAAGGGGAVGRLRSECRGGRGARGLPESIYFSLQAFAHRGLYSEMILFIIY